MVLNIFDGPVNAKSLSEEYNAIFEGFHIPLSLSDDMILNLSQNDYRRIFDMVIEVENIEKNSGNILSSDTYVRIGNFEYFNGNIKRALSYYDKALLIGRNNPYAWNSKAFVLFIEEGNLESAMKCFQEALKIHPHYATAMASLSYLLLKKGDLVQAGELIESALKANPEDARALAIKAGIKAAQGKTAEALRIVEEAILKKPMNILAHTIKGTILNDMKNYESAVREFQIALKVLEAKKFLKGLKLTILDGLAEAFVGQGMMEDALKYLNDAISLNPKDLTAILLKAQIYDEIGQYKDAVRYYTMSNVIKENPADMWYAKAITAMMKDNLESAEASLKKALFMDPTNHHYLSTMGLVKYRMGQKEEGIKYVNKALELNPKSYKAWKVKGDILTDIGSSNRALEAYENAIKYYHNAPEILKKLYEHYSSLGDDEKLNRILDYLIEVEPENPSYRMEKLKKSIASGNYEELINCLNDILRHTKPPVEELFAIISDLLDHGLSREAFRVLDFIISSDYSDDDKARAYTTKAMLYDEAEAYDREIEMLEKYLEIRPDDENALFYLGQTYENMGDFENALMIYDRLLSINPNSADAWYGKGSTYDEMGNYGEAIKCYTNALEMDKDDLDIWYELGVAHYNNGNLDEAEACFAYILDRDPNHEDALNARKMILLEKLGMEDNADLFIREEE